MGVLRRVWGIKHITQSFPSSYAPWPNPNPNLILCFPAPPRRGTRSLFLESSRSFSGPQSCFVYTVFTFKIKVSIILTMMQWNYQLTKQNGLFCELLELCYYSTSLTLKFRGFRPFEKWAPGAPWWGKREFKRGTAAIIVKGHYFFSLMAQCFTSDCDSNVSVTGP